jgi:branched-chain amino acid transport system permease protein
MPFIQLASVNLHYEHQTKGDTPIIFLHGNFGSWHYWQPYLQNLPAGYCGYAPDFRGCGDSEVTDSGYDIQTLCQDVLDFAEQLQLTQFHLVGHSLGGAVAQELAAIANNRIISLTLVSPVPAEGLKSLANVCLSDSFFAPKNLFKLMGSFGIKRKLMSAAFRKSMPALDKKNVLLHQAVDDALKMDANAFAGFLSTLKTWSGTQLLQHFNFPVLIMWGELDTVIPLQALKNMQQGIKNCRFHTFRHIGHAPQLEHPKAFNTLLTAFIHGNDIEPATETSQGDKPPGLLKQLKSKLRHLLK